MTRPSDEPKSWASDNESDSSRRNDSSAALLEERTPPHVAETAGSPLEASEQLETRASSDKSTSVLKDQLASLSLERDVPSQPVAAAEDPLSASDVPQGQAGLVNPFATPLDQENPLWVTIANLSPHAPRARTEALHPRWHAPLGARYITFDPREFGLLEGWQKRDKPLPVQATSTSQDFIQHQLERRLPRRMRPLLSVYQPPTSPAGIARVFEAKLESAMGRRELKEFLHRTNVPDSYQCLDQPEMCHHYGGQTHLLGMVHRLPCGHMCCCYCAQNTMRAVVQAKHPDLWVACCGVVLDPYEFVNCFGPKLVTKFQWKRERVADGDDTPSATKLPVQIVAGWESLRNHGVLPGVFVPPQSFYM